MLLIMFCTDASAPFLFLFSDVAPPLLYYSHLTSVLSVLLVSLFVFYQKRSLATVLLLVLAISFSAWTIFDLITWVHIDSRIIMFSWSFMNFFEPLVFVVGFYFAYVYLKGRDLPIWGKMGLLSILTPFLVLAGTTFNLEHFDLALCEAIEGPLIYFVYAVELSLLIFIAGFLIKTVIYSEHKRRLEVALFSLGIMLFLLAFFVANALGAVVIQDWTIQQYGMLGAPIFAFFIGFLIVRYQAFSARLFATQLFTIVLSVLIFSQIFFVQSRTNFILVLITFGVSVVVGILLNRSVSSELIRKNELQVMADELAIANQRLKMLDKAKSEFISIASHQLRTPLTAIKGFISLILEGSYGNIDGSVRSALNKVYLSNERLIQLVEDLLSISRIESGRLEYKFRKWAVEELVSDVVDMFRLRARDANLDLDLQLPKDKLPQVDMDGDKIREVISNLIDNAIKYTKQGKVTVSVIQHRKSIRILVQDSGIGIISEDLPHLFQKFSRGKDTSRLHANGTGLGLYVGKQIIEAHGGKLYAFSEGEGKGSTFVIELTIDREESQEDSSLSVDMKKR